MGVTCWPLNSHSAWHGGGHVGWRGWELKDQRNQEPGEAWEIKWTGRGAHLLNFLVEFFLIRLYSVISLPACTLFSSYLHSLFPFAFP